VTAVVERIKQCVDEDGGCLPLRICEPPPIPGREDTRPSEDRASFCDEKAAQLLRQCWRESPEERPPMRSIERAVERIHGEALRAEERELAIQGMARTEMGDRSSYVSNDVREINVEADIELHELCGVNTSRPCIYETSCMAEEVCVTMWCVQAGQFGEVYRGLWAGTEVALKRLHRQDLSKDLLDQMKSEIQVLQRLHHPNIVMLMGMCLAPPWVSIITEFLGKPGRDNGTGKVAYVSSIDQLLHDTKVPMPPQRIKNLLSDICKGMAYLHGFSPPILHRDLKPANLLITSKLDVRVSFHSVFSHPFSTLPLGLQVPASPVASRGFAVGGA
jgi:hypothetical protein